VAARIALLVIAALAVIGLMTALALNYRNERRTGYTGAHRIKRRRSQEPPR